MKDQGTKPGWEMWKSHGCCGKDMGVLVFPIRENGDDVEIFN